MEKRALAPYIIVIALMALTSLSLALTANVELVDEAGLKMELPERVGDWVGDHVRFCQDINCRRSFAASKLEDRDVCPLCEGTLEDLSLGEKRMLPPDTVVLKKRYAHSSGEMLHVTIVFSGQQRASIHRPEVCLVGQGRQIVRASTLAVPLEGRDPLKVKVLDLVHQPPSIQSRNTPKVQSYYAYWFVGKNRETPSHWQRMFWMGIDNVFRRISHRWAYISVGGGRDPESRLYKEKIKNFVYDFYPQIALN